MVSSSMEDYTFSRVEKALSQMQKSICTSLVDGPRHHHGVPLWFGPGLECLTSAPTGQNLGFQ